MRFSQRLPVDLAVNTLTRRLAALRRRRVRLIDLTVSNPTAVGLAYDGDELGAALADRALAQHLPRARGLRGARAAVAAAIDGGACYGAGDLLLTCSTSEGYALLFKLLCSPGDQVLVPRPSYPLLELLLRLEGVEAVPYALRYAGGWQIDLAQLRERVSARTRAVVVVNPNNPTGHYLTSAELASLAEVCGRRIALIGDEVFHEYGWSDQPQVRIAEAPEVLSFHLGGLSKLIGLPQLKLGWIGVAGPRAPRQAALRRLEIIADTYLAVGAPVQLAAPRLLALGRPVQRALRSRVRANHQWLSSHLRQTGAPITLLQGAGGWSGVLRLPAPRGEEALALDLLERERVVVHPGYFFDFDGGGSHLIVSLLVPPETLRAGVAAITRLLAGG